MASRVIAAEDLIAHDTKHYEEIIIDLANKPDKIKSIKSKICSSETSCTSYAYRILTKVSRKNCQNLAPHLNGKCEGAFLIAVGDYSGGSMGWDYAYNIYGLFSLQDKRKFVVPLKNFHKKNDAVNYVEKLLQ